MPSQQDLSVHTSQWREETILAHLPQVELLARRLHRRCPQVELEDLISEGTIGLIKAVDRFDPSRDLKVKAYAEHRIRGALLDYLRRIDPLPRNDLEAYALAYGIASLLNNLFGKGKEPFWQQAYTNLVKFIILLHKVNYDYVTLFDVYDCAINPEKLEMRIREGERMFQTEEYILVSETNYVAHRDLAKFPFEKDAPTNEMKSPISADLLRYLDMNRIAYSLLTETGPDTRDHRMPPWPASASRSRPSSVGSITTGGVLSRSYALRLSRAFRCSFRCSTITRPSNTPSVRRRSATTRNSTTRAGSERPCRSSRI